MFTSIHNHTECSNLRMQDCTIKVESLLDKAVELGYKGVCITDHEAVSGHVRFLEHYKELKKNGRLPEGFKIGLGNEIYLVDRRDQFNEEGNPQKIKQYHLILIAKDKAGHKQLREISTTAWMNWFRQGPAERVPTFKDDLERIVSKDPGHLICSTACLGGELATLGLEYLNTKDPVVKQKIVDFISFLVRVFGKDNLFLELQPRFQVPGLIKHDQVRYNQLLLKLSEVFSIPYIVSTDSHYFTQQDRYVHEAFLNSDATQHGQREMGDFYETTYMMTEDEIFSHLKTHMTDMQAVTAIDNTKLVYDKLEEYDLAHPVIVPIDRHIPSYFSLQGLFEGYGDYEYIQKFAASEDVQERYLLYLIEQGFIEKKQEFNETNLARINEELETLWKVSERLGQRIGHYYVLDRNMIQNVLWKESIVGAGRGSAAGSYICYLIGIIQVNPIEWNLVFWRHLHPSRPEMPDIDTDICSSKKPIILKRMSEYFGEDNVLQTLAFKTLTARSAVITACRGLGINDDVAHTLSAYVPIERGISWSLKDCFEGNPEKDRKPVAAFINTVNEYEDRHLKQTMLEIEGLICGRTLHASSIYVFSDGFLAQNSLMRAPSGSMCTAYNMHDSDTMGALKLDLLVVNALDKMQTVMNLLIQTGAIEDQGSLKATYDKYFHPDVIDSTVTEMWNMLYTGKLINAFQMDSLVGAVALKKIKPSNVVELASASSLMRLQAPKGEESPIDTYVRYKNDITHWFKEMARAGLTDEEQKVVKKYLLPVYGVAETQEVMMQLAMDPQISNFTVAEANNLRKSVAKKIPKLIDEMRDFFFKKGRENGTSQNLLNYVWNVQIRRLLGYGFSALHATVYAMICLQEMHMAYKYGSIFWNTACLTIEAGADTEDDSGKTTDYAKVGAAIGTIKQQGVAVMPPYINEAKFDFYPDAERNEILFSLKALRGLGDAQAACIVENQPFTSFQDFLDKTGEVVKPASVIALIKAGAFDRLESIPRRKLMYQYGATQAPTISKLSSQHLQMLKQMKVYDPEKYKLETEANTYLNLLKEREPAIKGKTPGKTWYYAYAEDGTEDYFRDFIAEHLKEERDYKHHEDGFLIVHGSAINRVQGKFMDKIKKEVLDNPASLEAINKVRILQYLHEKAPGSLAHWEMETMSFYYHPHELVNVDPKMYAVSNFNDLPEEPVKIQQWRGSKPYSVNQLTNIMGTVIGRNKDKHIVTLLTLDGVVNIKLYREMFVYFNQQLSQTLPDGKKKVIEESWFSHGNKLVVRGFRRGDTFQVRPEHGERPETAVGLITEVNDAARTMKVKRGREKV